MVLQLSRLPPDFDQRQVLRSIGMVPRHFVVPADIGRVLPDGAAWGVLAEGDRITAIDGRPVESFSDIAPLVQALGERREGDRQANDLPAPFEAGPVNGEHLL